MLSLYVIKILTTRCGGHFKHTFEHPSSADCIIWAFTPNGRFTVNSAYKVALSLLHTTIGSLGSPSNSQDISVFWKTLWRLKLKVPSKIRSFAWRACKNILPTKSNLHLRKVLDDPTCEACGNEEETTGHVLWSCEKAQEVWLAAGICTHSHGLRFNSFLDFLCHLIFEQHVGDELLSLSVTIAWSLWQNRNKARTGGTRQNSPAILHLALNLTREYWLANHKIVIPNFVTNTTWAPPRAESHTWVCGGRGEGPQNFKKLFYSIYIIYILKNIACKN